MGSGRVELPDIESSAESNRFLGLEAWVVDGQRFEIASRRKLDSRIVLPFFSRADELFAGLLERARPATGLLAEAVIAEERTRELPR